MYFAAQFHSLPFRRRHRNACCADVHRASEENELPRERPGRTARGSSGADGSERSTLPAGRGGAQLHLREDPEQGLYLEPYFQGKVRNCNL